MHSDDHILEAFLASNKPLASIATDLSLTLVAMVRWMDKNVDLLAVAKRAMETHIAFLALKAEAAALIDLTNVSSSTTNEERKRKSASQLLRHSAKRLLSATGAPPFSRGASSPSPRQMGSGEMPQCTEAAKGTRGGAISPTAPSLSNAESRMPNAGLAASIPPASMPSSLAIFEHVEGKLGTPCVSAAEQAAADPPYSDLSIDELRAKLARHFGVDLAANDAAAEAKCSDLKPEGRRRSAASP